MAVLTVGAGQQFTTIEDAASPGDTIDVQPGTYINAFIGIYQDLTLQAVGGEVQLVATEEPPNSKAIIEEGGADVSVTINGFNISGAAVGDQNVLRYAMRGGSPPPPPSSLPLINVGTWGRSSPNTPTRSLAAWASLRPSRAVDIASDLDFGHRLSNRSGARHGDQAAACGGTAERQPRRSRGQNRHLQISRVNLLADRTPVAR
jgi:hypothetical protein